MMVHASSQRYYSESKCNGVAGVRTRFPRCRSPATSKALNYKDFKTGVSPSHGSYLGKLLFVEVLTPHQTQDIVNRSYGVESMDIKT